MPATSLDNFNNLIIINNSDFYVNVIQKYIIFNLIHIKMLWGPGQNCDVLHKEIDTLEV